MTKALVDINDGTTVISYPYNTNRLRHDFPNTSFPMIISDQLAAEFGVVDVSVDIKPSATDLQVIIPNSPTLSDNVWVQTWTVVPKYDNLDEAKDYLKSLITAKRYEVETAGIEVNGMHISTDRNSQSMISSAIGFSAINPSEQLDWKTNNGWVQMTRETLQVIATHVGSHVQQAFSNERMHHTAVDNITTMEELISYNIDSNW